MKQVWTKHKRLILSIKPVRHLEYTEEIYRTEFPYSVDGMVNIPINLVWASWVRNGTTFLGDNRYFEIQT